MNYKELTLAIIFAFFLIIGITDLTSDFTAGVKGEHIIREFFIVAISLVVLVWVLINLLSSWKQNDKLGHDLEIAKQNSLQANNKIIEFRSQFRNIVEQQFSDWKLSKSEADVGWLLLKGLTLKEIAALRNTQEKTVRSQASSIYHKASLDGRHSFAAWFLEDIL